MPAWRKLHTKIIESLDFNEMPDDFTRLLWVMLPLAVDREGRGLDNPSWVKAKTMPLRVDVTIGQIETAMDWLVAQGMIERYRVNGRSYFWIPTWGEYQGDTSREAESNFPDPCTSDDGEDEIVSHDQFMTNSRPTHDLLTTNSCSDADADADEMQRESATAIAAPPPEAPPKTSKRTKKPTPPAVQVFREAAHRYPAGSWWADVVQAVGEDPDDLAFWEQCVKAWVGNGWNPTNVRGMLEFYGRREIPNGKARASPRHQTVAEAWDIIEQETGFQANRLFQEANHEP